MTVPSPTLAERLDATLLADPARSREQLRALTAQVERDPQLQAGAARGFVLRPMLLSHAEHRRLTEDLARLQRIVLSLPERLYGGDAGAMCEALGFPPVQQAAVEATWLDRSVVLSRADLLRTAEGFQAIEVNVHSSLGGMDSGPWHRALLDVPLYADFVASQRLSHMDPLDGIAGALRAACRERGLGAFPSVAVVDWPTSYRRIEARLQRLAGLLRTRGFDAFACHAGELTLRAGRLQARGRGIDVLYRIFVIEQVSQDPRLLGPVLAAHREGAVVLAMSFVAELVGNKGVLALLQDPAHAAAFDDEERATLARLLPWTRFVQDGPVDWDGTQVDLASLADRERDDLVLKPVGGYAARGVLPGWQTDPATWLRHVREAAGGPWILQRRVRPMPELAPVPTSDGVELCEMDVNWGAFLVGEQYGGMMIRAVPHGDGTPISTSAGALVGACLVERA